MVFILENGVSIEAVTAFRKEFEDAGFSTIYAPGTEHTAICLLGNTAAVDMDTIVATHPIVAYGRRVTEQYKAAGRTVHPDDTVIRVGNAQFGGGAFTVIAGPCSVENEEQIQLVAESVKKSGAKVFRGGAFKPRTSPYSFQGLGTEGLSLLSHAKKQTGLPLISEVMNQTQLPLFEDVDIIQIGARNMQNFDLLKEVGKIGKPVLLKRGLCNTLEEFLMSAEYIMASGNEQVILCERGIRTFETATRNTLDLAGAVLLKEKSHLPVIVDPSHAAGIRSLVAPMTRAAIAVGVDGVMIETHNNPAKALCDGAQSLDLEQFDTLMQDIKRRVEFEGRSL
ncbi:MAG: 3-deoxy-7-phosphoheptulonate synthase [Lachnospiraceae bacterium]|nr:3-deoxy-7-phosphoheptulonate synthase [Lachnospiraceae bacterium]